MSTAIKTCRCKHAFQDKQHGPEKRVHNLMKVETGKQKARCTVCSLVKEA